ncbi:MAG: hypothetical protein N2Z72_06995 [Bacteroidales bacterium]|nr:hypothetical protein [Bacteroidales bacterium]
MGHSLYKLYRSLKNKKEREEAGLFIAETPKVVLDLISSGIKPYALFVIKEKTSKWKKIVRNDEVLYPISEKILNSISFLKAPNEICGIFHIPHRTSFELQPITPILDDLSDPANLGIIIRTCHWFGIKHILATTESVDAFNLKTVLSSKGSVAHVHVHYLTPEQILFHLKCPIYIADPHGRPIQQQDFSFPLAFIIGNESHGIQHFSHKFELVSIPSSSFSPPDSLNAGIAASLLIFYLTLINKKN